MRKPGELKAGSIPASVHLYSWRGEEPKAWRAEDAIKVTTQAWGELIANTHKNNVRVFYFPTGVTTSSSSESDRDV